MILKGNIVAGDQVGYGELHTAGELISGIIFTGEIKDGADWVLPGFIDTHLHGIYEGEAVAKEVHIMFESAVEAGITTLCPGLASDEHDKMCDFLRRVKELSDNPPVCAARIGGSHLEGPFIEYIHRGGMNPMFIRNPDTDETADFLRCADGTLKIMTISPELPGAYEVIKLLKQHNVAVSAGHTGMLASEVAEFVKNGGNAMCHLFDAYSGRKVNFGVPEPCLADEVIVNDALLLEIIPDGVHVPETLLKLAIRAAGVDRIVAITDALKGAGRPDGIYPMTDKEGRFFKLTNGDACRLADDPDILVGSCLTMNRAFNNFCTRFGFSVADAAKMCCTNPAKYLQFTDRGKLAEGMLADIALLGTDKLTVKSTVIGGKEMLK